MRTRAKLLAALHPNAGLEASYRRRLERLIDEMHRSVMHWVSACYRANEPELAQDASPAATLDRAVRALKRRWQKRFDEASTDLAKYYATAAAERAEGALMAALKRGGFAVSFKTTATANDVLQSAIKANVSLIRSIPTQHFTQVEGAVMRSVQTGRDLATLTKELREQHGVTKRRAANIARDQNNKATAVVNRERQLSLGLKRGVWLHSGGGKHPRKSHLANSGKSFSLEKGWFDPDEKKWVLPGELISCRCVWRPVIDILEAA